MRSRARARKVKPMISKNFLAVYICLVLSSLTLLTLNSCTSTQSEGWKPRIYVGDHKQNAIVRGQEREVIKCADKQINDYLCMSAPDIERLFSACLEAKSSWFSK